MSKFPQGGSFCSVGNIATAGTDAELPELAVLCVGMTRSLSLVPSAQPHPCRKWQISLSVGLTHHCDCDCVLYSKRRCLTRSANAEAREETRCNRRAVTEKAGCGIGELGALRKWFAPGNAAPPWPSCCPCGSHCLSGQPHQPLPVPEQPPPGLGLTFLPFPMWLTDQRRLATEACEDSRSQALSPSASFSFLQLQSLKALLGA